MVDMGGATLVVVDDNPQITTLLRVVLARDGYRIRVSHCGEEALKLIRCHRPDVVILDLNMPGMRGDVILRRMQADRDLSQVPVIVATGETDPPDLEGAFATLTKPFALATLHCVVRNALNRGCTD